MPRDYMIDFRAQRGATLGVMAKLCQCTPQLLGMLEDDASCITHPHIASRIAHVYALTLEQYNDMIAKKRRAKRLPPPKAAPTRPPFSRSPLTGISTEMHGTTRGRSTKRYGRSG